MYRMMMFGKWLLIGTLIFHVLNANYVINQYAARVEKLEIAIQRISVTSVTAPKATQGIVKMDAKDQAVLDAFTNMAPARAPRAVDFGTPPNNADELRAADRALFGKEMKH